MTGLSLNESEWRRPAAAMMSPHALPLRHPLLGHGKHGLLNGVDPSAQTTTGFQDLDLRCRQGFAQRGRRRQSGGACSEDDD